MLFNSLEFLLLFLPTVLLSLGLYWALSCLSMVGPSETMSIPGHFSPMMPHSRPAWTALIAGCSPKSRW